MIKGYKLYISIPLLFIFANLLYAENEESSKQAEKKPVKAVSKQEQKSKANPTQNKDEIKLKGLTIKLKDKEVHMDAQICLDEGFLEYLMCLPNTFEHESIFVTKTKPELLHTGLLLIGMEPYRGFGGIAGLWLDKTNKKEKASMKIEIEVEGQEEFGRVNLNDFLTYRSGDDFDPMDIQKDKEKEEVDPDRPVKDSWIFTGSFFHETKEKKKIYAANLGGVVIAIWPQPASVIQFGEETLNPHQSDNNGLEISGEHGLTVGTNVRIIFSQKKVVKKKKAGPKKSDKKKESGSKKEPSSVGRDLDKF
jgi:hypothetical protein